MKKAIIHAVLFTGEDVLHNKVLVAENGLIVSLEEEVPAGIGVLDLKGMNLAPGCIDIQVNGGEQFYFSEHPTEQSLHDICDASLQTGATHTLPCLISSPQDHILQAIETVRAFMQQHDKGVIGMHLEGPFINPLKRGAHVKEMVRKPTDAALEEIIRYGKDVIKVMTIAPECFTENQLHMLLQSGIVLSAGHSNMTYEQCSNSFRKGISLVTHLYNAMTQLGHREPGMVGAVFDNNNVYAPIILDGAHCDYAAARIAHTVKGDHLFLISDAAFLNRKRTAFAWNGFDATLVNGFYRNAEGNLAGAAISMAEAIQNALQHLHVPLPEAIRMATLGPAKAIQMDHRLGRLAPGYPARFIRFDNAFKTFETVIL